MKIRFGINPFEIQFRHLVCMARPGGESKPNPINAIGRCNQLLSAGRTKEGFSILENTVLEAIKANTFSEPFHPVLIRLVILYETTGFLREECSKPLDARRREDLSDILTQAALMSDELQTKELTLQEKWMLKRDLSDYTKLKPGQAIESKPITLQDFSAILTRLTSLFESASAKPSVAKPVAAPPVSPPPAKVEKPAESKPAVLEKPVESQLPTPPPPPKPIPKPTPTPKPTPVKPEPTPTPPEPVRPAPPPEPPVLKLEPKLAPKPEPAPEPVQPIVLTEAQQRAQQSCRYGQGMLAGKRFKEAIPHYRHALETDPENTKAQAGLNACAKGLMDLAEAALSRGQEKGARTLLSQAETANPPGQAVLERIEILKRRLGLAEEPETSAPKPAPAPREPIPEAKQPTLPPPPTPEPAPFPKAESPKETQARRERLVQARQKALERGDLVLAEQLLRAIEKIDGKEPDTSKEEPPKPPELAPDLQPEQTPAPLPQKHKVGRPPLTPEQIVRKRQIVIDWLTADPERMRLSAGEISVANAEIAGIIYNGNYFGSLTKARLAAEAAKEKAAPATKRDPRQEEVIGFLLANPGITTTKIMREHHRIHQLLYKEKVFPGGIKEARAAAEEARKEKEHLK